MTTPIIKRILPIGRVYGHPGYRMTPTSITIHNTANERAGADAEMHAKYLEAGHRVSWHFTADADSIVQHLPIDHQGWHTGTNAGNTTSVGIEVCEYPNTADGRAKQARATENAAWLAAKLMRENRSIKRVVTHKSWSGKICPRDILPTWSNFLKRVDYYAGKKADEVPPAVRTFKCDKSHIARRWAGWKVGFGRDDCSFVAGQRYAYAGRTSGGFIYLNVKTKSGKTVQAWGAKSAFHEV